MCDQTNSYAVSVNEKGLIRPSVSGHKFFYNIDFGNFNMIFEKGYVYIPKQTLYADVDLDLKAGDYIAFNVAIPTTYLNCNTGISLYSLTNPDIDDQTDVDDMSYVMEGTVEWLDESAAAGGEWKTLAASQWAAYNGPNQSEMVFQRYDDISENVTTCKLRWTFTAGPSIKHKIKVLYGKVACGESSCFSFKPVYSVDIEIHSLL